MTIDRLVRAPRTLSLAASLALAPLLATCGGGDGCPTCPKPDTTPPAVQCVGPAVGAMVTSDFTINNVASDAESQVTAQGITLDGNRTTGATRQVPYAPLANGSHSYSCDATSTGGTRNTTPNSFTVQHPLPTGQLRASVTPSTINAGQSTHLGAKLTDLTEAGAPDSFRVQYGPINTVFRTASDTLDVPALAADSTRTGTVTGYFHNATGAGQASSQFSVSVNQVPTAQAVTDSHNEGDSSLTDLSAKTTGDANRTYRLVNVPSDLTAILQGSVLKVKQLDANMNGSRNFLYIVTNPGTSLADTAQVNVTVNPMTDISYNLTDLRSGNLITEPTWVYIDNDSALVSGGHLSRKLVPGTHSIGLMRNPNLFQFSIVTQPDGTKGYNWASPVAATASTSFNFNQDFATAGTLTALIDTPPADTNSTYNRVTFADYVQAFPTIPVPIIPMTLYVQKKVSSVVDASFGTLCDDADSTFLQRLIQGADSAVAFSSVRWISA